ncbi:tyrosine-type recombinase/integrase [Gymnodinialimonas hymeniacidonis]|uniref:tyrosine-type recombinase/integrase n=1 Tax=Gymnodinialimonas hymeniacidonis TaxID=3126508 RepID=UPI0034C61104
MTYWDNEFPGLGLRCTTRAKFFVLKINGSTRPATLGVYPEIRSLDARNRAATLLNTPSGATLKPAEDEFAGLVERYLHECSNRLRDSTASAYAMYLTRIDLCGNVATIKRREVLRAIQRLTPSPSSQNHAYRTLKAFFSWLELHEYVNSNPLDGFKSPHKLNGRERTLSEDEVRNLLKYVLVERGRFHDIVSLLIMTGQRRGEIAGLRWGELDGDWVRLGGERTKNGHAHNFPLPSAAKDLIKGIQGGKVHVFGTHDLDKPFSGWSRAQRRLLRETGISAFTLHDLRRTFATLHAKIGTPPHVIERLLNHKSGAVSGVAAIYNRHHYEEEMLKAMSEYEKKLASLQS